MTRFLVLVLFLLISGSQLFAQPTNDNCNTPITLTDITNYCSRVGEFTNVDATPSGYGAATCWPSTGRDVWFRFRAFFTDVNITIIGINNRSGVPGGTLSRPMVALYRGVCGGTISELRCGADLAGNGALGIYQGGLVVGVDYYIRVDGINNSMGTFQLCLNNFNPPALPGQDCNTAGVLCDKTPFVVQKVTGGGRDPDEAAASCLGDNSGKNSESSSVWFTWIAANDGTLTFTLKPLNPSDDIDYALYELPSGIHKCSDKILLRCNATAPPCAGPTGLNLTDPDISENLNCNSGENGYCKFIDMQKDHTYTLVVNNFTDTGIGFSVEWGGTGEFAGPVANFGVDPPTGLKCETDFVVADSSTFVSGSILRWTWNFGKDAIPQTAVDNAAGVKHSVRYNSFGEKYISLTIITDIGCQITEIRRIYVEPCCEDLPTLRIGIDSTRNLSCFESNDGMIAFNGNQGTPFDEDINGVKSFYYQYSLNGQDFSPTSRFINLPAGTYTVYIQDRKGCTDSIQVVITQPDKVVPNAGSDLEIDLGDFIDLNATVVPGGIYNYNWERGTNIDCINCQNTKALPINDGYYTVRTTNENGCTGLDSFFVRVRKNYDVFTPNVFSPNGDNINDFFFVGGSKSIANVDLLQIFDRWGNLIYEGKNLQPNNQSIGWNGRFKNQSCNPGVYVYLIKARFLDDHVLTESGDLSLLK
ncbi:MAG: gliding motility-associated C-terminal domain-containing protein [Saprospiraceae bacterium]|nr:gliding motility-associated C-terminal domain-containing protein [Saprospiraceae bacterium]MBK9222455.1 gliding motility-associated C-terminal domain-containing protein [Saprospiraceae bacterium]MBK9720510.1 gliding motility-associated C-terminal domain-containing protein [Saprospiraceae bacterium]